MFGSSRLGGDRLVGGDLAEQLVAVLAVEGGAQGRQLVEGGPEAVDVRPGVELAPALGLFWAQVAKSADRRRRSASGRRRS